MLATVLCSAGIPAARTALLVGVAGVLDMSRTALNVTADLSASTVLNRLLAGGRSAEQERSAEAERESQRRLTGDDVVLSS